jgi:hypothetical protein
MWSMPRKLSFQPLKGKQLIGYNKLTGITNKDKQAAGYPEYTATR